MATINFGNELNVEYYASKHFIDGMLSERHHMRKARGLCNKWVDVCNCSTAIEWRNNREFLEAARAKLSELFATAS